MSYNHTKGTERGVRGYTALDARIDKQRPPRRPRQYGVVGRASAKALKKGLVPKLRGRFSTARISFIQRKAGDYKIVSDVRLGQAIRTYVQGFEASL